MKAWNIIALLLAVLVGYLIGTSPAGVSPPAVPTTSPLSEVPPWPVFRIAVGLNDMLRRAYEASTLPKVRVLDLATARFQSQVIHILTKNDVRGQGRSFEPPGLHASRCTRLWEKTPGLLLPGHEPQHQAAPIPYADVRALVPA